ncbi:hypothetical protein SAMN04488107_2960 [Geodermatophilus saharensis]|uniref:Phage FDXHR zinc binding domain-containing protein n=1 Tax=Geodermatophilus saharensis TaxID=1137994 RepID=A0A239FCM1_9ACTN|nr:hypothetical protein SAMN04488107_2960 [Geodermatophilus saharensis]
MDSDSEKRRPNVWNCSCGRLWTGLAQAHCPTCHEHFSSASLFDRHRPRGVCVQPATARRANGEPLFRASQNRYGTTWVTYDSRAHPHSLPTE